MSTDEEKPWDIALYLSQVFWQAEDRRQIGGPQSSSVGPSARITRSSRNTISSLPWRRTVLMASRPHDRMGVAFWYNWLSDEFKDLVSPVEDLRDFWGVELYYNIALNKWLHLSPNLQFIKNEHGGQPEIPSLEKKKNGDDLAIIPGLRLVMDF